MAVYARDVLTGDMPGPYTDSDADHFARLITNAGGCDPVSAPRLGQRVTAPWPSSAAPSMPVTRDPPNRRWPRDAVATRDG
jgi:hypothetical protein